MSGCLKNEKLFTLSEENQNDIMDLMELLTSTTWDILSNVDISHKVTFQGTIYISNNLEKQKNVYRFLIEQDAFRLSFYGCGNVRQEKIEITSCHCDVSYSGVSYSFSLEPNTNNSATLLQFFSDAINNFHATHIFIRDYQRIFRDDPLSPLSYVEELVNSDLFKWEIDTAIDDEDQEIPEMNKYSGSFGEELFELGYQEDNDKQGIYNSYLNICVGEHMKIHISQIPDKKIKDLISPRRFISIEDVVVRTSQYFVTNHKHDLEFVRAHVCMYNEFKQFEKIIDAYYSAEYDIYLITKEDFNDLSDLGRFGCRVIIEDEGSSSSNKNTYASWNPESVLYQYGYSVSKKKKLSSTQRHRILMFVYKNNIMELEDIIRHIEWVMDKHQSANDVNARKKWREDIDFLKEQRGNPDAYRDIIVRNIYVKQRHYMNQDYE